MKKYVFLGAYDNTDMLIYIAKILTLMGKKVILVDTTVLKKSRYVVPKMINEKQYITTFEDIDVAIGFESFDAIRKYQRVIFGKEEEYDIALIDIDRAIAYEKFGIEQTDYHFFVTSFDIYHLKRGIQLLAYIPKGINISPIYYSKYMLQEETEYLHYLAKDYKISWETNNTLYFPLETSDLNAIYTNQRSGRIQMKGFSKEYIEGILFLVEVISGESNSKVRKAYKLLEN